MNKFEVGDKVRVIASDEELSDFGSAGRNGDEFVISELKDNPHYKYLYEMEGSNWYKESFLERIVENKPAFKTGDKVRVTEILAGYGDERYGIKKGQIYEVVEVNTCADKPCVRINAWGDRNYPLFFDQVELVKGKKPKSELCLVYKVVSLYMKSAMMTGDKEIEYALETQVKPKSGYIHAFDAFENAKEFAYDFIMEGGKILLCVGRVVTDDDVLSEYISSLTGLINGELPKGTLLCRWVFPIEEVNEEEYS